LALKKTHFQNKFKMNEREQLPYRSKILCESQSFFISKNNLTHKYTSEIRQDIREIMKSKGIGWTKLSKILFSNGYTYNPSAIQTQITGKPSTPMDIKYFVPILILLNEINLPR
jgi:hypothetical protein